MGKSSHSKRPLCCINSHSRPETSSSKANQPKRSGVKQKQVPNKRSESLKSYLNRCQNVCRLMAIGVLKRQRECGKKKRFFCFFLFKKDVLRFRDGVWTLKNHFVLDSEHALPAPPATHTATHLLECHVIGPCHKTKKDRDKTILLEVEQRDHHGSNN